MKKLIYGTLFLTLVGIGFVGCKKKENTKAAIESRELNFDNEFHVASDGKLLIFKTTADYYKIVNNPSEELQTSFIKKISSFKHTSYLESLTQSKTGNISNSLGDPFLMEILNEDWIVQIGDYLYRINKPTESVFVLPVANISEYQDLVSENKSNPNIRKFSTTQDVIELAESGAEGEKGLFCNEAIAKEKELPSSDVSIPVNGGFTDNFNGTVYYRMFGIYFILGTQVDYSLFNSGSGNYSHWTQIDNSSYAQRCGNESASGYSHPWRSMFVSSSPAGQKLFRWYQGATRLKSYNFRIRIRCEQPGVPQGSNPYTTYFTQWLQITG